MQKDSLKTAAWWIIGIALSAFLFQGLFINWGEWHETGEGTHVGYVTAVGKHGLLWRTWDVHFKTDAESTQENEYCVRPAQAGLIEDLRQASDANARVEIHYKSYLRHDWGECKSAMGDTMGAIIGVRVVQ